MKFICYQLSGHHFLAWISLVFSVQVIEGGPDFNYLGYQLQNKFSELKDELVGVNHMQGLVDDLQFEEPLVNGKAILEQFSEKLSVSFKSRLNLLREIKDQAEHLLRSNDWDNPDDYIECCRLDESQLDYSPRFKTMIGSEICYRISADSNRTNIFIPVHSTLTDIMKDNYSKDPSIKWQYFGTEYGTHIIFPQKKNKYCDTYDPRYRPWYVETIRPVSKDIIIAIDQTTHGEIFNLTKTAATTVIDTLNPNDRVALVVYNFDATTPPGDRDTCYQTQMAYATPDVKKYFKSYIQKSSAVDATRLRMYIEILEKSFDTLSSLETDTQERQKAILFLTGSTFTGSALNTYEKLQTLNARQNNSVMVLSYGIGDNIDEETQNVLRHLANMTHFDETAGERIPGYFTTVRSKDNIRLTLAGFHTHFTKDVESNTPVVPVPYIDFSGLGTVTGICLPVYNYSALAGATCIDITLADITQGLKFFNRGEQSYMFLIDDTGRTMIHPSLPSPGQHYSASPIFLNIDFLEPEAKDAGILNQMKAPQQAETFEAVRDTDIITYWGNASSDGVTAKRTRVTYYCKQIIDTKFCACFVLRDGETALIQQDPVGTGQAPVDFVYHKLELQTNIHICTHYGRNVTTDNSAVKFSPLAYKDSEDIFKPETCDGIKNYKNYFQREHDNSDVFQDNVRKTVETTSQMTNFWKKLRAKVYNSVIKQSYMASTNGVLRMFPGQELPQTYDYSQSLWYTKAKANMGKVTVIRPHMSVFGHDEVITMAHTITHSKDNADLLYGIIAVDFHWSFLHMLMMNILQECSNYRCFLVDEGGFVVSHPYFEQTHYNSKHLAEVEPTVMDFMFKEGYITPMSCVDYAWKTRYHYWRIDEKKITSTFRPTSANIQLYVLEETNLCLVITDSEMSSSKCPVCDTNNTNVECPPNQQQCHCPCFTYADFNHCTNQFNEPSSLTCSVTAMESLQNSPNTESCLGEVQNDEMCFPYQCYQMNTSSACSLLAGCTWCAFDPDCGAHKGYCVEKDRCKETKCTEEEEESSSVVVIAAATVGSIVVIAAGVVILLCVCHKKLTFIADREPDYNDIHTMPRQANLDGQVEDTAHELDDVQVRNYHGDSSKDANPDIINSDYMSNAGELQQIN